MDCLRYPTKKCLMLAVRQNLPIPDYLRIMSDFDQFFPCNQQWTFLPGMMHIQSSFQNVLNCFSAVFPGSIHLMLNPAN
jgi:hypothetical protein